jgi:hypothetical protein
MKYLKHIISGLVAGLVILTIGWSIAHAETPGGITLPQGGLGITTVTNGNFLVGSTTLRVSSTPFPGYINVVHASGSNTIYSSASDPVGRGTDLVSAVTNAATGDTIYLAPTTFDINTTAVKLPAYVSLYGIGSTTIYSEVDLTASGPSVAPGTGSIIDNLSIVCTLTPSGVGTNYCAPLGFNNLKESIPATTTIRNVNLYGDTDGFYFRDSNTNATSTVNIYNSNVYAKYDAFTVLDIGNSTYNVYNTSVYANGPSATARGSRAINIQGSTKGVINYYGGSAFASNGNQTTDALQLSSTAGVVNLYGTALSSASTTNPYDIDTSIGTVNLFGTNYDPTKVNITGTGVVNATTTLGTKVYDSTRSLGTNGYLLQTNGLGTASWVATSTLNISQWTTSGNNIYNNNSGNVGISSTTPTYKLSGGTGNSYFFFNPSGVSADVKFEVADNNPQFVFNNTGGAATFPQFILQNQGTNEAYWYWDQGNSKELFSSAGAFQIDTGGLGNHRVTIDSTGNLGVGATSPAGKLTVGTQALVGASLALVLQTTDQFSGQNIANSVIQWRSQDNSNRAFIGSYTNVADIGNLEFGNNGSTNLILTSAGKVGIGTTSPFTNLSVAGSAYIGGNLTATGTVSIQAGLKDSSGSLGSSGQLLNSTGSATQWINNPSAITGTSANLTGLTTASTITTYTPASDATLIVGGYITVTSVATDIAQYQVTYTDETSTSRTQTFFVQGATSANIASGGAFDFPPMTIRAKSGSTVTLQVILTVGTGSITYDAGGWVQKL